MLWRFGFASSSTLDALLTREVPPSLEELLDEQDVLAECKALNGRLVAFMSREDSVKSLLHWVVAGLDELDQAAAVADTEALSQAITSPDLYPSFRTPQSLAIPRAGPNSPPLAASKLEEVDLGSGTTNGTADINDVGTENGKKGSHGTEKDGEIKEETQMTEENGFVGSEIGLGKGLRRKSEGEEELYKLRYPNVATEILCCDELWAPSDTIVRNAEYLLTPFWDAILPPIDPSSPATTTATSDLSNSVIDSGMSRQEVGERERARKEFWSDSDETRDKRREMIRGMWMRVNGTLITKRTPEMIRFIRSLPNVVERIVARITSPAVQDVLIRIVSAEEGGVKGTIDWLAEEGLIPKLLQYFSPHYCTTVHATVAEVLKSIITLCAPTPFNPHGGNAMGQQAGQNVQPPGQRDNRLIRELVSEQSIDTMIGFMLDPVELTDQQWGGINGPGEESAPADPFIVHPLPSVASATSSLTNICSILVEVIRRNNSDFSEPHLFHTLRNRLMSERSQSQSEASSAVGATTDTNGNVSSEGDGEHIETEQEKEEKERRLMEEALANMSSQMGIVHLGHLLNLVSERFDQFHQFVLQPRSQDRSSSAANPKPFTLERFRIIEFYAELLHSSNMSILNRVPGTGPTYTEDGVLSGGLDGLEALGAAIDGDQVGEEEGNEEEDQVTQARELPVSSGSTDASLTGSDDVDVASEDEDMLEHIDDETTPSPSPAASGVLNLPSTSTSASATTSGHNATEIPPPPSSEDAERLRDVMEIDSKSPASSTTSELGAASNAAVATSTAASSIASDIPELEEETEEIESSENGPSATIDFNEKPQSTPGASLPPIKTDLLLAPGDRLKKMYLDYHVIPTVVDLFFEYPNNDFMHHVVYDVLQQILNGRLGPGLNRDLAVEIISKARLVERVLDAQRLNDRLIAQPRTPRLAYMGHIILIAEELVKFFVRCPPELYELIKDSFVVSEWEAFVDTSLTEAKARDTKPLAGGKPMSIPGANDSDEGLSTPGEMGSLGNARGQSQSREDDSSSDDDDDDRDAANAAVKFGEPLTRTHAADGFASRGEFDAYAEQDGEEENLERFWRNSGVGLNRRSVDSSDDDDDDDADWLRPGGDDEDFGAWETAPGPSRQNGRDEFEDDDGWGTFHNAASPLESPDPNAENPFGDDNFVPSVVRAEPAQPQVRRDEPLTPRDWAEQFDRAFEEGGDIAGSPEHDDSGDAEGDADVPAIVMPSLDDDEEDEDDVLGGKRVSMSAGANNWTFAGDDKGVDLPPTMSPTLPQGEDAKAGGKDRPEPPTLAPAVPSDLSSFSTPKQATSPTIETNQLQAQTQPQPIPIPSTRRNAANEITTSPSSSPNLHPVNSASPSTSPTTTASNPIAIPVRRKHSSRSYGHHSHPGHPSSGSSGSSISSNSNSNSSPQSPLRRWGEAFSPPDPSLIAAATEESPLGPGVSRDTHITDSGLLEREVGGKMVRVPQDEIVEAIERKADDDEDEGV